MNNYMEKVTNLRLSYTRGGKELTIRIPGPMILEGVLDSGREEEDILDLQFDRPTLRYARRASPKLEFNISGIALVQDNYLTMSINDLD